MTVPSTDPEPTGAPAAAGPPERGGARDGRGADVERIWTDVRAGGRRALAKALSVLESGDPRAAGRLTALAHANAGHAHIVGITGAPGVGKSSLTSALVGDLRQRGQRVAVIAVDPSSPFTHGAVLGDRIRMQDHVEDGGVFIRSMATRGHLGGLCAAVPTAVILLDAAGYESVLVETVGVGQSEVAVAGAADTVLLVLAPGLGDSVQAEKAGIMEIADIVVVNKADHEGAGQVESAVSSSIRLTPTGRGRSEWIPPVVRTVALRGEGVAALADTVAAHLASLTDSGELMGRRVRRARHVIEEIVLDRLRADRPDEPHGQAGRVSSLAVRVASNQLDPYAAAELVLTGRIG